MFWKLQTHPIPMILVIQESRYKTQQQKQTNNTPPKKKLEAKRTENS